MAQHQITTPFSQYHHHTHLEIRVNESVLVKDRFVATAGPPVLIVVSPVATRSLSPVAAVAVFFFFYCCLVFDLKFVAVGITLHHL
jgi:hypothetical protein